jgi:hypothetical protein
MFRDFARMVNDRFPAEDAGVVALRREGGGSPIQSGIYSNATDRDHSNCLKI